MQILQLSPALALLVFECTGLPGMKHLLASSGQEVLSISPFDETSARPLYLGIWSLGCSATSLLLTFHAVPF
jgi:hypothetical protein